MAVVSTALLFTVLLGGCGGSGGSSPDEGVIPPPPVSGAQLDVPIADLIAEKGSTPGSVVLRFTAPGATGEPRADAYVVRASTRHITQENAEWAPAVPNSLDPGPPGTAEVITLTGLERDRTLQFSVQTLRDGSLGPVAFSAGGRVAGRDVDPLPPNAISLSGPATLSMSGATYRVTQDFSTAGTAFRITAANVVLDLDGHTVTYGTGAGTSRGVLAEWLGDNSTVTVRNGTLRQGGGGGSYCHAVLILGVTHARVSYLDVDVTGPDSHGISTPQIDGSLRIDHCSVHCGTTVVTNRHYPGVAAINAVAGTGSLEIDHNVVTASPQWGIWVQGTASTGDVLVHHNRVVGTKALVANGYMLALHKPNTEAFENYLAGESRGIHIDGIDGSAFDCYVHDNDLSVQDQPNPEYPDRHWVHGIKIEGAHPVRVERNSVLGVADPQHAEVYALDLHVPNDPGVLVQHNRIRAISQTSALPAYAVGWTAGPTNPPNPAIVRFNVFTATDRFVERHWDGRTGCLFQGNWWIRDLSQGAAHPFLMEYFNTSDVVTSLGHRFVDPFTTESLRNVGQWADPTDYSSTREWTLTVTVSNAAQSVSGARVTARDRFGATVMDTLTGTTGMAAGVVTEATLRNGPTFTEHGPYQVRVTKAGYEDWEGSYEVRGRTGLLVDLGEGTASLDATDPTIPAFLHGHALSASRAMLWWAPSSDDGGISTYLVYLDGEPVGITKDAFFFVAGLTPSTTYVPSVRAVDVAGRESPVRQGAAFGTRVEDRGP